MLEAIVYKIAILIYSFDDSLFKFINQTIANSFFDFLMPILRNKFTWVPVYIFLFVLMYNKFKNKFILYVLYFVIGFAIVDFSTHQFLKPFFHRVRPCYELMQVRLLLDSCGGKWSFPSSHAANHAFIAYGLLLIPIFKNKLYTILIILWPILVGFAQIYVGVHYPLDILIGYIYGILIAILWYKIFRRYLI